MGSVARRRDSRLGLVCLAGARIGRVGTGLARNELRRNAMIRCLNVTHGPVKAFHSPHHHTASTLAASGCGGYLWQLPTLGPGVRICR